MSQEEDIMYRGMHAGEMAQALTDYQVAHMTVAEMMDLAREATQAHFDSLPPSMLVVQYEALVGGEDHD